MRPRRLPVGVAFVAAGFSAAKAQDADLAKKLGNPAADLIGVPIQFNCDGRIGAGNDGGRARLNIQPLIPITNSSAWNLISRTVLPVIWQSDIAPDAGRRFGLSDTTQSLFKSPRSSGADGGVWGMGHTTVVLKQFGPSDRRRRRAVPATLCLLHGRRQLDLHPQQRGNLRLGQRQADRADQRGRLRADQDRPAARQPVPRRDCAHSPEAGPHGLGTRASLLSSPN